MPLLYVIHVLIQVPLLEYDIRGALTCGNHCSLASFKMGRPIYCTVLLAAILTLPNGGRGTPFLGCCDNFGDKKNDKDVREILAQFVTSNAESSSAANDMVGPSIVSLGKSENKKHVHECSGVLLEASTSRSHVVLIGTTAECALTFEQFKKKHVIFENGEPINTLNIAPCDKYNPLHETSEGTKAVWNVGVVAVELSQLAHLPYRQHFQFPTRAAIESWKDFKTLSGLIVAEWSEEGGKYEWIETFVTINPVEDCIASDSTKPSSLELWALCVKTNGPAHFSSGAPLFAYVGSGHSYFIFGAYSHPAETPEHHFFVNFQHYEGYMMVGLLGN